MQKYKKRKKEHFQKEQQFIITYEKINENCSQINTIDKKQHESLCFILTKIVKEWAIDFFSGIKL